MKLIIYTCICICIFIIGCLPSCPDCEECIIPECTNVTITKYVNITTHNNSECNCSGIALSNNNSISNISLCEINTSNSYTLGLIQEIKRLEKQLIEFYMQNDTTLCEETIDDLNNCELRLGKIYNLSE